MTVTAAVLVLLLSLALVAWGAIGLARRRRTHAPRPPRAVNWQSPAWNVIGVIAGIIGALAGVISLFK